MLDANVFKSSFRRHNLYYEIRPKVHATKEIIKFILANHGKSGIIYCLSRKKVEQLAETLIVNGIKALPYHAGMDAMTTVIQPGPVPDGGGGCDRGHHCLWNGD